MAQVDGNQLMAEGLKEEGVDTIFYILPATVVSRQERL